MSLCFNPKGRSVFAIFPRSYVLTHWTSVASYPFRKTGKKEAVNSFGYHHVHIIHIYIYKLLYNNQTPENIKRRSAVPLEESVPLERQSNLICYYVDKYKRRNRAGRGRERFSRALWGRRRWRRSTKAGFFGSYNCILRAWREIENVCAAQKRLLLYGGDGIIESAD